MSGSDRQAFPYGPRTWIESRVPHRRVAACAGREGVDSGRVLESHKHDPSCDGRMADDASHQLDRPGAPRFPGGGIDRVEGSLPAGHVEDPVEVGRSGVERGRRFLGRGLRLLRPVPPDTPRARPR